MTQSLTVQGRIVWGHPGKLLTKKDRNRQVVLNKEGQPVQQCAFGLAIPKNLFEQQPLPSGMTVRQHLETEARSAFPHGTPNNFAWKFKDGDGVDHMGRPYAQREGHAGNYILTISTQGFAPPLWKSDGRNGWTQMKPEEVKCGDFVAVDITVKYNGSTGTNTPGLYINPNGVLFLGYGSEISSAADPDEMFGKFQPAQFAGMSLQPVMPQGGVMPSGMSGQNIPQQQPGYGAMPMAPAPVATPNAAYPAPAMPVASGAYPSNPAQLPPPAHDFVQNAVGAPNPQYGYAPAQQQPVGYPAAPVQPQGYPSNAPVAGAPMAQPGIMPGMPMGR